MATLAVGVPTPGPNKVNLSTSQTGTGQSTNVAGRYGATGPALLTIVSTVGGSPTVTVAIEGSSDGSDWFPVAYADAATPETVSVATFAITTATTTRKILRPFHPWSYLRLTYSANTNVTLTADVFVY